MISTTGNRLPPDYTVRSVRTVRRHMLAKAGMAGDSPSATVRRPSGCTFRSRAKSLGGLSARPAVERGRSERSTRRRRGNPSAGMAKRRSTESIEMVAKGPSGESAAGYRGGNGSAACLFRSTASIQEQEGAEL